MSEADAPGAGQANPVVVFDNVKYDVIAGPSDATPLVQLVRTAVLQALQIDKLLNHLNRTDAMLYVAACGVAGLMHPTTQQALSAQVMGLQYKLRTNTGEIGSALLSLGESARSMLAILRGAFKDLYSLYEADAVTRLARCAAVATQMAESAGKLEANFQSLVEEAGAVLRLTSETCNMHKQGRLPTQQRQLEIDARDESTKAKRAELELQMRKVQALYEEAKAAQATADERVFTQTIASHIATAFGGAIPGGLALKMASLKVGSELAAALAETRSVYAAQKEEETETPTEDARLLTEEAKKEKSKYLDMLMDLQKQEREALDAMAQNALKLGSATDNEEVEEAAVVALHHAVVTLKQIAAILAEHKRIWTQVAMDSARFAQADLRTDIEGCIQRSREERMEAYSERGFQLHMLAVAAQWHALQLVAGEYRSAIQAAYVKMGETYAKNPTIQEARQLAPVLGTALAEDVAAEITLLNERTEQMTAEQQEQATVEQAAAGKRPGSPGV